MQYDLQKILDRFGPIHLASILVASLLLFGLVYWALSAYPGQGIVGAPGEHIEYWDAVYFGMVTEATLGYGDYRPVGIARIFAAAQVMVGLLFAGIVVAKFTSAADARHRRCVRAMTGIWCNSFKDAKGKELLGILHFSEEDGEIKYGGENYDVHNEFQGAFSSTLIGEDWPHVLFRYRNVQATGLDFTEGIIELRFHVDGGSRPNAFVGSFIDFGRALTFRTEGFRVTNPATLQKLQDPRFKKEGIRQLRTEMMPN